MTTIDWRNYVAAAQPASEARKPVLDRLVEAFVREVRKRDPEGRSLARIDSVDEAAAAAAQLVVDTGEEWREHLGGFFDVEVVRRLLGSSANPVTKQAVSKRRGLLALRTESNRVVYPRFQFVHRHLIDGLGDVMDVVPEDLASHWTVASWLVSENPELDNERPIDVLAEGRVELVVEAARSWSGSLSA